MLSLWETLRKRLVPKDTLQDEADLDLISSADPFEPVMGYCLQQLNTCSAGTAMYLLDCLCPGDCDLVLELIRLDLGCPHQHNWFSEKNVPLKSDSYEDLLALLRALTNTIPEKEYPHFWLELTKRWLLTCPADPAYCVADEAGGDLFCKKLRGELVERILNIS